MVDEPLYAHYLEHTGLDHPMREQIIASGDTDWQRVTAGLSQPPEQGIYYQKHIATHWLDHFHYHWLDNLDHLFLIREPEPVVASYAVKREGLTAKDLGYSQQAGLFDYLFEKQGKRPLVIDSRRFLADPASQLKAMCASLSIDFQDSMLEWPAGRRDSDGVWGTHWYDAVIKSTGFAEPVAKTVKLTDEQRGIAEACRPYYDALAKHAL